MKKITIALLTGALAYSAAFAGSAGEDDMGMQANSNRFGVTIQDDELTDGMNAGFTFQNDRFEAGLNFSAKNQDEANDDNWTQYYVIGNVGLRRALSDQASLGYGLISMYSWGSGDYETYLPEKPYTNGLYTSLEYDVIDNIQGFVRILPYSYERESDDTKHNNFFSQGQIGLTYFIK